MIDSFQGEYRFLSNFWDDPVELKGRWFPTAEHAFQACKTASPEWQKTIQEAETPARAKLHGRNAPLREGWDEMKVRVMTAIIQAKFRPASDLGWRLMQTGSQELVEGNTWDDKFWGCVREPPPGHGGKEDMDFGTWVGANHLGLILMAQRGYLQHEIPFA